MGTRSVAAAVMKSRSIYETLQAPTGKNQEFVTGTVRMKLYKGMAYTISWTSPYSLYNQDLVTFEESAVAHGQRDAARFIKLNALRLTGAPAAHFGRALNGSFSQRLGCIHETGCFDVSACPCNS